MIQIELKKRAKYNFYNRCESKFDSSLFFPTLSGQLVGEFFPPMVASTYKLIKGTYRKHFYTL